MVHARKKQALLSSPTCIGAQVQVALGQRLDCCCLKIGVMASPEDGGRPKPEGTGG